MSGHQSERELYGIIRSEVSWALPNRINTFDRMEIETKELSDLPGPSRVSVNCKIITYDDDESSPVFDILLWLGYMSQQYRDAHEIEFGMDELTVDGDRVVGMDAYSVPQLEPIIEI
jgi:hypothetical protein